MTNNEDFDFPGAPDPEAVRAELVRTGGPMFWRPHGRFDGTETDLSGLSKAQAEKVIAARLQVGPGPTGTPWQWAIWSHHNRILELQKEEAALLDDIAAVKGFDPVTGEGISLASPTRAKALADRLSQIGDDLRRHEGEPGRLRLAKELDKAVAAEMRRHRAAYIEAEAKRRAGANAVEAEIERRAANYRKTLTQ